VERCYQVARELLKFLNGPDRLDRERDVSLAGNRFPGFRGAIPATSENLYKYKRMTVSAPVG